MTHSNGHSTNGLPTCPICEGHTRLYGTEPHPRLPRTDLHTYGCDTCGTTDVMVVPIAAKVVMAASAASIVS